MKRKSRKSRRSRRSLRHNPRRTSVHRVGGGIACYDNRTKKRLTKVAHSKRQKIGTRLFCGKAGQKFAASHAMIDPPLGVRSSRRSRRSSRRSRR